MNTRLGLLGILLSSGLLVAVACGGGEDGDDDDSSSGGLATGGFPTGGWATSGGTGASTASGGAATGGAQNATDCPTTEPTDGDDCANDGGTLVCTYDGAVCSCFGFGGDPTWDCQEVTMECPDSMPDDGDGCTAFNLSCNYTDGDCVCEFAGGGGPGGGQFEWNCDGAAATDCPNNAPDTGDGCDTPGQSCSYDSGDCICGEGDFGNEWFCNTDTTGDECPADAPNSGDDCTTAGQTCQYGGGGGDETCICALDAGWQCF